MPEPLISEARIAELVESTFRKTGGATATGDFLIERAIRQAIKEAGLECAKVCVDLFAGHYDPSPRKVGGLECAAAIKRRIGEISR